MRINTTMLIETMKAQAIGESIGKIVKGKDIEAIKETYGAYGFSLENWIEDKKNKKEEKLYIGDKTQMSLFAINGLLGCIKSDCIIYNQTKIRNSYIDWFNTKSDVNKPREGLIFNYSSLIKDMPTDAFTIKSFENIITENKVYDLSNPAMETNGLLALTRAIPFAFFAKSDLEAWVYGGQQAVITHGGEKTWICCSIMSLFVFKLLKEHKRIKSKWKSIKGEKETLERYYRQTIDLEKILTSTINVSSNFKNTQPIINKLKFTLNKIKAGNEYKDIYIDFELHERFGEESHIEDILCVALYIACVSKSFDIALEIAVNNNYDKEVLAAIVAPLFVLYHKGASLDYLFNEIDEHNEIEDFLYEAKRQISDTNYRMLTREDVTKDELVTFIQMKAFEKGIEKEIKSITLIDKIKKLFSKK